MKELSVALIGQGFMGKAHSNAFCQAPHFFDLPFRIRRKLICGRDAVGLERMAATWGWDEISTDWRAIVERADIDVIDIAAPNSLHAEIAIAAAGAGKTVLCEKPLATSVDDAVRMADAVRGRPNMVWFNYRRVPALAFARQLIEQGRIGKVFHYRGTYLQEWGNDPSRPPSWKTRRAEAGSGALGDLLSHAADLAMWLNGPISEVAGMLETFAEGRDIDDAAMALVRFANGSAGYLEATRYATGFRNGNMLQMHGQRGMLRFNLEEFNNLQFFDATGERNLEGPRNLLVGSPFWKPGHVVGYEHTFIAALADFVQTLSDGSEFHPNFDDALRVQRVLTAVELAAERRGWVTVD